MKKGKEPSYIVCVQKNGKIVIGDAYTRTIGLRPGDEFHIQLAENKSIYLDPITDSNTNSSGDFDEEAHY